MEDEIRLATTWFRYFSRPAKHYAPRPCQDYARWACVWAGTTIRLEAFLEAASQLGYKVKRDEFGRFWIKASVTA